MAIALIAATILSALALILLVCLMAGCVKKDINRWLDTGLNPFNLLFRPDALTPDGLAYRKAAFVMIGLMFGFAIMLTVFSKLDVI